MDTATATDFDIKPTIAAGFDLKGLKTWNTNDGGGYQFTLTHKGKPVAEVTNDGHGGPVDVQWMNLRWDGSVYIPSDVTPVQRKKLEAQAVLSSSAKSALDSILAATPRVTTEWGGDPLTVDEGWAMGSLVDFAELRKLCVKKTVFRPVGKDADLVIKAPYDAKVKAYIESKYPGATIYNETFGASAA